ncbi:hypothetical protein NQ315_015636 [Exocentrus adspersus]|uniref:Mannose-P-dolichol utilization defect 1 protein homolog n=1 Tax=Exocentrus adspersus TaxID=1586481 RepID=A0AAV8W2W2_9CUCU|nr:hypothetical protein NQ315_015636 [Exocentrus adspersus]
MNSTIATWFRQAALLVFTPHCFDNYFIEFNYFDGPCFSATLSKCLGLGIILGSLLVKIPQILKLVQNKSGEGISITSVTFDLAAITIYMSYSFVKQFPFSSWGDTSFLAIQTVIVAVLVLIYENAVMKALIYLTTYLGICYVMMSGITPINVLWTLQTCNIPIVVIGKLIQAWANFKNGHTGQLSAITMFMLFFGSAARIFTSIQETGDTVVILTYTAGTLANSLLVFQILYYWNVQVKQKAE